MLLETFWQGFVFLDDPSRGQRLPNFLSLSWLTVHQGDEVYLKKPVHDESVLPLSLSRPGEETPRVMSSASSDRSYTAGNSDGGS
jgi:hypothetical protein